jgi:hypothetical protein
MSNPERLQLEDEDHFFSTLVSLTRQKHFRSAWQFLQSNVDPQNIRVYDAGVALQSLSNEFGDIGDLKDECLLRKDLERKVSQVIKLLI